MKTILQELHISAKPGFSARKPYPGCMASESVTSAAEMMRATCRYESAGAGGPIQTASSAKRTWRASRSASEYTATVEMPNSLQARITRRASSPRLAIRIFLNIRTLGERNLRIGIDSTRFWRSLIDAMIFPRFLRWIVFEKCDGSMAWVTYFLILKSGWPNSTGWPFSTMISCTVPARPALISFMTFIASRMQTTVFV